MTENIDTSVHIKTHKESLIPAIQLLNRQDMQGETKDGFITKAYIENKYLAWKLVQSGYIEECDYYDAMVFMDLRRAYESSQGVKWRSMDASLLSNLGLSAGQAIDYYDTIKHAMGLPKAIDTIRIIIAAMTQIIDRNINEVEGNMYRNAFDKLTRAMQDARKIIDDRKKVLA